MALSTFITSSVALLITLYTTQYRQEDLTKTLVELQNDLGLPRIKTYDMIVVGGGSAGCILASRLSEHFSVLLLEKGGPPPPIVNNPYAGMPLEDSPDINDVWLSVPQANIKQENGGINNVTTGRMLGGSGSHNGNIYNRGSVYDYDSFATLLNDPSWNFNSTLQYYKRIENFVGSLINENDRQRYYGTGGPINVETDTPPSLPLWFQAGRELGYKICDPHTPIGECFTYMIKSSLNGIRSSAYTGYLEPIMGKRSSLTVLTYSEVDEILTNDRKVAYGVAYRRHGIAQIAHARREVILSASTFVSPTLLMKSGIGPRKVLESSMIPVVSDVPGVGLNLHDHVGVYLEFITRNSSDEYLPTIPEREVEAQLGLFQSDWRSGFFTRKPLAHSQAFLVSQQAKKAEEGDRPDIQLVFKQTARIGHKDPQKVVMHVIVNRLESRGEVSFNSTAYRAGERDPGKLNLIDYKLLNSKRDQEVLLEAIQTSVRIMENTTALRMFDFAFNDVAGPKACSGLTVKTLEYWRCFMAQRASTWWHQVGTCKMGDFASDKNAVVDSRFKVRGVKNLRVVDASVFPFPINANVNSAVFMIAEKAVGNILRGQKVVY